MGCGTCVVVTHVVCCSLWRHGYAGLSRHNPNIGAPTASSPVEGGGPGGGGIAHTGGRVTVLHTCWPSSAVHRSTTPCALLESGTSRGGLQPLADILCVYFSKVAVLATVVSFILLLLRR